MYNSPLDLLSKANGLIEVENLILNLKYIVRGRNFYHYRYINFKILALSQ